MCLSVHMVAGAHRGKKKVLDTLDLEVQVTVNCLTWVLKTNLGSFVIINHFPSPQSPPLSFSLSLSIFPFLSLSLLFAHFHGACLKS